MMVFISEMTLATWSIVFPSGFVHVSAPLVVSSFDFSFFLEKREEASLEELEEMGLEEMIEVRLKGFLARVKDLEMSDLHDTILQMAERPLLKLILKQSGYNQIKAAKVLGINRNTLRKKIKDLGILLKKET